MPKRRDGDIRRVIDGLRFAKHETVILFVPSHDKSSPQKPLEDQALWAHRALELFGRLYGGATAFKSLEGIWKDEKDRLLYDQPVMVQSLASRSACEDPGRLHRLFTFCTRMGRETNQAAVALVFSNVIHYITVFGDA
jgi:hypothetical protein